MQFSANCLTSLISFIQSRSHAAPVPEPDHPVLQGFIAEIEKTLYAEGPTAAAAHCGEALIAMSGLLELADKGDPMTAVALASSNLTTEDLTQFGLWLDQRSEELTTKLS